MSFIPLTILDRFIFRELLKMTASVTLVLTVILLSNQLVRLLAKAVEGQMSGNAVLILVGFNLIALVIRILPAAMLISVLMVFGRMYRDQEMTAITAAGVGVTRLYRSLMLFAIPLALLGTYLSFVAMPWSMQQIDRVMTEDEFQADLRGISAGRFHEYSRGDMVFYVEKQGKDNQMLNVFVQNRQHGKLGITASETGIIHVDPDTGDRFIVLNNGYRFEGHPGQAEYQITQFKDYAVRVAEQKQQRARKDVGAMDSSDLRLSKNAREAAEWHRRLALPLSIVVFALLALPISRVSPRGGMYGNLITALLIYVIYENFSNLSHSWMVRETVPIWFGMWWVHLLLVLTALLLVTLDLGPKWVVLRLKQKVARA